ncbi:lysostaphin resistance A-like protein [Sphingobacterium siyangense]|uniref:CPBP family intramembrane glutamic endopeptidase n=1 Tax=Sphingobacterium siyangense TaxID=459529 RepID=UPI003C762DA5
MKTGPTLSVILVVLVSFSLYYVLFLFFGFIKRELDTLTRQGILSYILTYFIIGTPIFLGTYVLNKRERVFKSLGLSSGFTTGLTVSLLFVLPMLAGGLFIFGLNKEIAIENLIAQTIIAGFMEELYFRGFLFGQLFRKTKLGFIPAIFFGALLFASGHLYQSQDINRLIGIFIITFMGAVFFAWLFTEWKYNLWVPIWTHTLMNLTWILFDFDNTSLGGSYANLLRGATIAFAIVFTIVYKKRKSQPLAVNKRILFLKKGEK